MPSSFTSRNRSWPRLCCVIPVCAGPTPLRCASTSNRVQSPSGNAGVVDLMNRRCSGKLWWVWSMKIRCRSRDDADLTAEAEIRKFRDQVVNGNLAAIVRAREPIFLKHPLSALFLPQICKLFDTHLVYVVRPIADIETTRVRRNWAPAFGAKGAELIYSHMFQTFVEHAFPTSIVRYNELLDYPERYARMLLEFAGLPINDPTIKRAAEFINSRSSGTSSHGAIGIGRQ